MYRYYKDLTKASNFHLLSLTFMFISIRLRINQVSQTVTGIKISGIGQPNNALFEHVKDISISQCLEYSLTQKKLPGNTCIFIFCWLFAWIKNLLKCLLRKWSKLTQMMLQDQWHFDISDSDKSDSVSNASHSDKNSVTSYWFA